MHKDMQNIAQNFDGRKLGRLLPRNILVELTNRLRHHQMSAYMSMNNFYTKYLDMLIIHFVALVIV